MLEDSKLKVFSAVAATGSFTAAARRLGISQPAVSQTVSELERTVGANLFVRARGAVSLTAEGGVFKLFADRILSEYENLNAVFSHYQAYSDLVSKLEDIKKDPEFEIFRDLLLK